MSSGPHHPTPRSKHSLVYRAFILCMYKEKACFCLCIYNSQTLFSHFYSIRFHAFASHFTSGFCMDVCTTPELLCDFLNFPSLNTAFCLASPQIILREEPFSRFHARIRLCCRATLACFPSTLSLTKHMFM